MPNLQTQTQLVEELAAWQEATREADQAMLDGDIAKFYEASGRIHDIEERQRRGVAHA